MLVVERIARIRREHLGKGTPIRKLVRDLKVARNTIRKAVRSDEPSFSYDRTVQPRPKLDTHKKPRQFGASMIL